MDVSDRRLQVQLTQEAKIASASSFIRAIFAFAGFVSALSFAFGETSSTTPPIFPIVKSGRLENPNGFNLPPGMIKVRKGVPPSREFGDSLPGTACRGSDIVFYCTRGGAV